MGSLERARHLERESLNESCKFISKSQCKGMIERNSRQSDVGGKFEQLLKSTEDNGTHNILLLKFIKTRLVLENFWLNINKRWNCRIDL